jgi:hypothetical protein
LARLEREPVSVEIFLTRRLVGIIASGFRRRIPGCLFQPAVGFGQFIEQALFAEFGPLRAARLLRLVLFAGGFLAFGFGLAVLAFFAFRRLVLDLGLSIKIDNAVINRRCGGRGRRVR